MVDPLPKRAMSEVKALLGPLSFNLNLDSAQSGNGEPCRRPLPNHGRRRRLDMLCCSRFLRVRGVDDGHRRDILGSAAGDGGSAAEEVLADCTDSERCSPDHQPPRVRALLSSGRATTEPRRAAPAVPAAAAVAATDLDDSSQASTSPRDPNTPRQMYPRNLRKTAGASSGTPAVDSSAASHGAAPEPAFSRRRPEDIGSGEGKEAAAAPSGWFGRTSSAVGQGTVDREGPSQIVRKRGHDSSGPCAHDQIPAGGGLPRQSGSVDSSHQQTSLPAGNTSQVKSAKTHPRKGHPSLPLGHSKMFDQLEKAASQRSGQAQHAPAAAANALRSGRAGDRPKENRPPHMLSLQMPVGKSKAGPETAVASSMTSASATELATGRGSSGSRKPVRSSSAAAAPGSKRRRGAGAGSLVGSVGKSKLVSPAAKEQLADKPLPRGWVKKVSKQTGKEYFMHGRQGITQWHHPSSSLSACETNKSVHGRGGRAGCSPRESKRARPGSRLGTEDIKVSP